MRPKLWRRYSVVNYYENDPVSMLMGIDPREPDPVWSTLREAARMGWVPGRTRNKSGLPRRRCYSENTNRSIPKLPSLTHNHKGN